MKREEIIQSEELKVPYFYAPLTGTLTPSVAYDSITSVYKSSINQINSNGLALTAASQGVVWDCSVPVNTDLTFSCWVNRTGGSGVNYSFGTATKNNARYYGLQLSQYNSYWLMQEYLYFCYVGSNYLTVSNAYVFITWSITYNGNNNYTITFYKNGVLITTKTFSNTQWLGMANCFFAIGHFTNSMYASYKHFSCYPLLTDSEVLTLYQNNGEHL